jgi:hypothetical protein
MRRPGVRVPLPPQRLIPCWDYHNPLFPRCLCLDNPGCRFTQGGKRHAVSLRTGDEAVAIVNARAILAEGLGVPGLKFSVDHAITEYLRVAQERAKKPVRPDTARRQGYILRKFERDAGIECVGQITHKSIDEWLRGFKDAKRSGDTLHTYARSLHTFVA